MTTVVVPHSCPPETHLNWRQARSVKSHSLKMTAGKAWNPSSTACCRRWREREMRDRVRFAEDSDEESESASAVSEG